MQTTKNGSTPRDVGWLQPLRRQISRNFSRPCLAPERHCARLALRSEPSRADLHGSADHATVSNRPFYGIDDVPVVDGSDFRLKVSGVVQNTKTWTLPELYALPKAKQIARHISEERWSAIGRWGGIPFSEFLKRVGADTHRRNMLVSSATTTTKASTCRQPCIRRPRWRSPSMASNCQQNMVFR